MRVLLDTMVIVDALLNRAPWDRAAAAIWLAHQEGRLVAFVAATTLTDVAYLVGRALNEQEARKALALCVSTFAICPIGRSTLERALQLNGSDVEDNVLIAAADLEGLDAMVTRDVRGFVRSIVPVYAPEVLVAMLPPGANGA